jgi:hypothetical protein
LRFFFYGTLLDAEIRRLVLGAAVELEPALLRDWQRVKLGGGPYGTLVPGRGAAVTGGITPRLAARALRRLYTYEGPEYRVATLRPVLADGARPIVSCFLARARHTGPREEWRFEDWAGAHRAALVAALRAGRPV